MANEETIKAIKDLQKEIGAKSVYDMAKKLLFDDASLRRYLRGESSIGVDTLVRLCKKQNIKVVITLKKIEK